MTGQQPYLSVVAASRNDDHGKNLHRRMQIFVNGFLAQCHRFQIPAELIMVDWNPPPDKLPLAEALSWPVQDAFCSARIIQVPATIHQTFEHSEALPLFQMIAKNVGIRRARGEFILATNIDILLNDALMQFIAQRRLQHGVMYRINRFDVAEDVPLDATIQEQLAYCEQNLIRINGKETVIPTEGVSNFVYRPHKAERLANSMPFSVRQFYCTTYEAVLGDHKKSRTSTTVSLNNLSSPRPEHANITAPGVRIIGTIKHHFPNSSKHQVKLLLRRVLASPKLSLRRVYKMAKFPHTNACGDFTLLAREDWFEFQGYPEDAIFSMHLDSVFCCAVWFGGIQEKILYEPMRAYHIEHATGSGYTPEGWNSLVQRLEKAGIPQLSYDGLLEKVDQMRRRQLTTFNDDQWGLFCEVFEETVISVP